MSIEKRVPICGALFLLPRCIQSTYQTFLNVYRTHTPKSEHEKPNRHSLFHHFLYKVGFGFLMFFFIGMGLGMNIEIAVVLFYGCSDSGSHKECDCINRLDDV
ncbi:hypothetical protein BG10_7145 [Bacillus thuringiensis serovar morrisoni]|nr:hypothetical protein BG10_7135 [Bacillus thuringiensis serovar morrisoni]KIP29800.1 hypothetical protein BG10_7145 [Bacillus thuringiensis serovar morrisoni]PDY63576.1 hypothetical protein COM88_19150 [Bacillus cereus]PEC57806.1 hypothetical protein CON91_31140 [Bacillus wiedmannii]PGQ77271.1 hypothetical protein COA26_16130 [Bacillus cereus]